ncbi:MAG: antitoxin MazE-like protein [Sphingomonadaceae bacterium]
MNDHSPRREDKYRRYRARKKAKGLKEIRMWVPDVNAPGFWERSVLAAAILRDAPEEEETMLFIEAMQAEDPELWD